MLRDAAEVTIGWTNNDSARQHVADGRITMTVKTTLHTSNGKSVAAPDYFKEDSLRQKAWGQAPMPLCRRRGGAPTPVAVARERRPGYAVVLQRVGGGTGGATDRADMLFRAPPPSHACAGQKESVASTLALCPPQVFAADRRTSARPRAVGSDMDGGCLGSSQVRRTWKWGAYWRARWS